MRAHQVGRSGALTDEILETVTTRTLRRTLIPINLRSRLTMRALFAVSILFTLASCASENAQTPPPSQPKIRSKAYEEPKSVEGGWWKTVEGEDKSKPSLSVLEIQDPAAMLEPKTRALLTEYFAGQIVLQGAFRLAQDTPPDHKLATKIARDKNRCTITAALDDHPQSVDASCTEDGLVQALQSLAVLIKP
jgi:hypothetical protein